jgi:gliding motility-associated-like protein
MRKSVLFIFFSILFFSIKPNSAKASHAAGGEIAYEWVSDSTYRLFYKFFRDCSGAPELSEVQMCVLNTCTGQSDSLMLNKLSFLPDGTVNGSPVSTGCGGYPTKCSSVSATIPGYREWWYSGTITLPSRCSSWRFSVSLNARNTGIANLQNSSSYDLYLEATLNNVAAQGNSSPFFSVKPVPYVCYNQPYTYNNGVIDANGDSLSFEMLQPLASITGGGPGGFTDCSALPYSIPFYPSSPAYNITNNPLQTNGSFSLSSTTGQMSFTPTLLGQHAITMRVNEYRHGVKIGSVMRDIQVQVLFCNTVQPTINTVNGSFVNDSLINGAIETCIGTPMSFCYVVKTTDTSALLVIKDNHTAAAPGSLITYTGKKDSIRGCFSWTPTAADAGLKIFTVTVKDSTCKSPGISVSQTFSIPIFVRPIRSLVSDTILCIGDTILLVPAGGTSFKWSVMPGGSPITSLSCTTCMTPLASPKATTRYIVITDYLDFCSSNIDTMQITVKTIIPKAPVASSNDPVCEGDTIRLFATNVSGVTYKWTGPNNFIDSVQYPTIPGAMFVHSGVYIAYSMFDGCHSSPAYTTVGVHAKPEKPKAASNSPACEEQTLSLYGDAASGAAYYWNHKNGYHSIDKDPQIKHTQFSDSGVYSLFTIVGGCKSDTAFVDVKMNPKVIANIVTPHDTICQYDTIELSNEAQNPPTAKFEWDFSDAKILEGSGEGPYSMLYQRDGMKQVMLAVTNLNCVANDTERILVKPAAWAYFQLKDDVCINELTEITPYLDNAVYTWSLDGANIHDTTKYGTYHASWNTIGYKNILLELMAADGCISRYYHQTLVHDYPAAKIESVSSTNICTNDIIKLQAASFSGYSYKWIPERYFGNDSSIETFAKIPLTGNIYLTATDSWGCVGKDSVMINTKPCCDVYLPDAFTPNGDGHNDKFRIITIGNHDIGRFAIVNRWGQQVFETTNEDAGWDGTFNGKPMETGTYFYYLRYKCSDDQQIEKKGEFVLIR